MKTILEYQIPYKGLSIGKHEYEFHAQEEFFASKQVEGIENGDLIITFILDRQSRLMQGDLRIEGSIKLICDRCLESFDYKINIDYNQIYKFGEMPEKQNDDLIYLSDSDFQIDISELIIENIMLEIPIKKIHPNDKDGFSTCNTEQIELINEYVNKKQADPRWDALKNIKFDN